MLILGCGNLDRSDDAAGLLVKGCLPVQNPLDCLESWTPEQDVILVDAVVSGAPAGTILEWDAIASPLTPAGFRCSTHGFGVAEMVELARALGRLPKTLVIYGIEAKCFDAGGKPSPEVMAAVDRLTQRIEASKTCSQPSDLEASSARRSLKAQ